MPFELFAVFSLFPDTPGRQTFSTRDAGDDVTRYTTRIRNLVLVAVLALLTTAATCGHEANGDKSETEKASANEPASGDETGESSASEESADETETTESGMLTSKKQRIAKPDVDEGTVEQLAAGNTAFGFDLYGQLRKKRSGENFFFSPYNLSQVLAMAYGGASGKTASEMKSALRWELEEARLHPAFNALDGALERDGPEKTPEGEEIPNALQTANGVWSQKGMAVKDAYLDLLAEHYGAGLHPVDFVGAAEEARGKINDWAEDETKGKIKDLLPEGSVDARTRMVLTAAIYFRGNWADPFQAEKTAEADFHNLSGETATVDMMHQKARTGLAYTEGNGYKAVELPYGPGEYSMVVVLPDEGKFEKIDKSVDAEFGTTLFEELEGAAVDLTLPKFKVTSQFSVAAMLESLGMKQAFTSEADFSGITEEAELFISDVLHKSYVAVDEKGTEAAAASAAVMRTTGLPAGEPDWKTVVVDRPFLFMIRHTDTNSVLFAGRVVAL